MSKFEEFDSTENTTPTIVVDVRATHVNCGKTTLIRALWKALADLGLEPESDIFSINSQDEDTTGAQINSDEIQDYLEGGVANIKRLGTRIHFVDTNKRPLATPLRREHTTYMCRFRVYNQAWSKWSVCNEETYRAYVENPVQGHTHFETKVEFGMAGGLHVEVPEIFLTSLQRNLLSLNEWGERMAYDESLVGEPAGLIKGKIRELTFMMNNLMSRTYVSDAELGRLLEMAKPETRDFIMQWTSPAVTDTTKKED